jgi:hypothetical protein
MPDKGNGTICSANDLLLLTDFEDFQEIYCATPLRRPDFYNLAFLHFSFSQNITIVGFLRIE